MEEILCKIKDLIVEAQNSPDWTAEQALRCLYKELTGTQMPRD